MKVQNQKVKKQNKTYRFWLTVGKVFGYCFVFCVLFFVGIFYFAGNQIAKSTLEYFAKHLKNKHGIIFTFDKVETQGISSLSINSLVIKATDQKIKFRVKEANLSFSLVDYFYKPIPLNGIQLKEPSLFIEISNGSNIEFSKNLSFLKKLKISDGLIHLKKEDHELIVAGIKAHYDAKEAKNNAAFYVSQGLMVSSGNLYPINEFSGQFHIIGKNLFRPASVQIEKLFLKTPQLELSINGKMHEPSLNKGFWFEGFLEIVDLKFAGTQFHSLAGEVIINRDFIEMEHVEVDVASARTWVSFRALFQEQIPFALVMNAQSASLYDLLFQLGISHSWVDLGMDIRASGTGHFMPQFELKGHAEGALYELIVADRSARNASKKDIIIHTHQPFLFETDLVVTQSSLFFQRMYLDDGLSNGMVNCFLPFDDKEKMQFSAQFNPFDLSSVRNQIASANYKGFGELKIKIDGPYKNLVIYGDGEIKKFQFEDYQLGDFLAKASYQKNILNFKVNEALLEKTKYEGEITFDFGSVLKMDLKVDLLKAHAENLRKIISKQKSFGFLSGLNKLPLYGPVRGGFHIHGPITKASYHKLSGSGFLQLFSRSKLYEEILEGGLIQFHLDEDFIHIDDFELQFGAGGVTGSGEISKKTGDILINLSANHFKLSDLTSPLKQKFSLKGDAHFSATLNGKVDDMAMNANWHASGVYFEKIYFGDVDLSLTLKNQELYVQGPIFSSQGHVDVHLKLTNNLPFLGQVYFQYMSLDKILNQLDFLDNFKLFSGGEIKFQGTALNILETSGTVNFFPTTFFYKDMKLLSSGAIAAHFQGPNLHINRCVLKTSHQDSIRLKGTVSLTDLNLQMMSQGDLWLLPLLDERIELAYGHFFMNAVLKGEIKNPSLKGILRIEDGYLLAKDYAYPFEKVIVQANFVDKKLQIEKLSSQVKNGIIRGQGVVFLSHYLPHEYNLSFEFLNVPIVSSWMTGKSNGNLNFTGKSDDLLLSGNVTLFESLVTKSIDLDYFSFNYASAPRLIDPRKKSSRPLGFDVYVKGKEEIRIENDSLNADFDFNLHVMGNKENIGLVGVINASSGDVLFRNHRYRLLKSKLYFDNPYRIAPRIDIEMEGKVLDYDISARLEGSIEEPQFHLRSQPSLSEVDILSLMTMGFVGRYIKDTMNTARTASLEAISNYTHIGQTLIQLLPYKANNSWMHLDEIRLTSLFSKQRGMSLPAFLMGFDIVKGLKLRLKTALLENDNGRIEQSIELERQFNKKMRWRLSWDSEGHSNYGDAGVDLWYRLEL